MWLVQTGSNSSSHSLQERGDSEVETIRNRYHDSVESVMQLAEKDIQELRTYANPPATITHVMAAICTILGFPTEWESALMLLNHATVPFIDRITQFDIGTARSGRLAQLRTMFADDQLDPLRVRSVSRSAHSLVLWLHAVDSYGHIDDIRAREHRALRGELDQAATKQVLVEMLRSCCADLILSMRHDLLLFCPFSFVAVMFTATVGAPWYGV